MADMDWTKLATTQSSKGPVRTAAQGKTPRDKMLSNFDQQLAQFNSGRLPETRMGRAKSWFKDNDGEVSIQVRFAGKAISLLDGKDIIFIEKKNLKAVAKGLRQAIVDGQFEAEIVELEKALGSRIEQRKATRQANKK